MACVYQDPNGWIAQFSVARSRGGGRRRVRVPRERIALGPTDREAAQAFAEECARYNRLLDVTPNDPKIIATALALKAIPDQKSEGAGPKAGPFHHTPHTASGPLTIREAADMDPATKRDRERESKEIADRTRGGGGLTTYQCYTRHLDKFIEFSGVKYLCDLRLEHIEKWIAHLKAQENAYDTRRHKLLYIRRATKMGATVGIPNVLPHNVQVDVRGPKSRIPTWTLEEVADALHKCKDLRGKVGIALGAFMGLRPSEIIRANVGHLQQYDIPDTLDGDKPAQGWMLQTGWKNNQSDRDLPIPGIVFEWISELVMCSSLDQPILTVASRHHRDGVEFSLQEFNRWLIPNLPQHDNMTVKHLRKTFLSIGRKQRLDPAHVRQYMGHADSDFTDVENEHYNDGFAAGELHPTAIRLDAIIRQALDAASLRAKSEPRPQPPQPTENASLAPDS